MTFPSPDREFAIALRSTVLSPRTMVQLAEELDGLPTLTHVFVPDIPGALEALDISSACLAVSKDLRVGSGVIRILEHDPPNLARRLSTIQELSGNRLVLGIGTGRPGPDPRLTIQSMLDRLTEVRKEFEKSVKGSVNRLTFPETFIATLRPTIAKAVFGRCDGILLNFCSPEFARDVVQSLEQRPRDNKKSVIIGCYMKVFYSRDEDAARRMLIEEFAKYDQLSSYHSMFESDGVASEIRKAKSAMSTTDKIDVPSELLKICLANPSRRELADYVDRFRNAGVTLPCVYPYFEDDEENDFKRSKVKEIAELLRERALG